ncbi:helix-turn-helix domain-containing protein [Shewanella submarina]|uniref:Sugar diacid recognition domain-containing protein n=1 Tax=Shewanella submarina TaxID=2016376 RepID=A0ABV7G8P5_9GAMM|nr:sugar diacid recognition domain-containing protein [Shewanella submarina]MCL1036732.1 helix-turn-helix domain-containing protein [Shewanella submarina]
MYQLDATIAGEIVHRTMKIIGHNINVMNGEGVILGSGDVSRLGQCHQGACEAIAQGTVVEIPSNCEVSGVKPGINLPLTFQGQIIGVIGITGEPEKLSHYGELLKMTAEMIVEQANLMDQLQWKNRRREEFILQLIKASAGDIPKLANWARQLDLDIRKPRVAAIIEVNSAGGDELKQILHLLQFPERDNLVAMTSLSRLVILKPAFLDGKSWSSEAESERIDRLLERLPRAQRNKLKIALGHFFPGDGGIARSYQSALETLTLGQRLQPAQNKYLYQEFESQVLLSELAASWRGEELSRPYVSLLASDKSGQLCKTLDAYIASGGEPGACADALYIHRNTLRYRLDKISRITGLDLSNLDQLLRLNLARLLSQSRFPANNE